MSLSSKPLVEFPFAPGFLKLGFESDSRWQVNRDHLLALLAGKSNLHALAQQYRSSWLSTPEPTVLHYRDYLLAQALGECSVNCQYRDGAKDQLTSHAEKVWGAYAYDEIWDYYLPEPQHFEYKYADLLGTPGYYLTQINNQPPSSLLQSLVTTVWSELGLTGTPTARLSRLYSLLRLSGIGGLEQAAQKIANGINELAVRQRYQLRRLQLQPDFTALGSQIFFGEYDAALDICAALLSPAERTALEYSKTAALSILRPAGGLLVTQVLAIEGYLKAIQALNALPETNLRQKLEDFYTTPSPLKYDLAVGLALAYDAYSLQSSWNSLANSRSKARALKQLALYWLGSTDTDVIPAIDPSRLTVVGLYEAQDLTLSDIAESADPQFLALQQQPPRLSTTTPFALRLLRANKQFGQQIQLTTTDVAGNVVDSEVFPIFGPGAAGSLIKVGPGSYQITFSEPNPIALVAADPGTTPVPLDTYLTAEGNFSNVISLFPVPASPDTPPGIEDLFDSYGLLFGLQNTSNPRGSDDDLYAANGFAAPQGDFRTDIQIARDDVYGFREEITERTLGYVGLLNSSHRSAVTAAGNWLPKPASPAAPAEPVAPIDDPTTLSGGNLDFPTENLA